MRTNLKCLMTRVATYASALLFCYFGYNGTVAGQTDNRFQCESILEVEYTGIKAENGQSTWNPGPPTVYFRITKILKGPPLSRNIPIRYDLDDSRQRYPMDWRFDESSLPKIGSKWILFIPEAVPESGRFVTFHGPVGRVECTPAEIELVNKKICETLVSSHERAADWDSWDRNIDQFLQSHFEKEKIFSHGPRYRVTVAYTITENGKVENVRLIAESESERFNQVVLQLVNSLTDESLIQLIQFPVGSKTEVVEKQTSFTNHLWYDNIDDHV